jgi:4,4'-diaponeurosporenoate glycosyltransferase
VTTSSYVLVSVGWLAGTVLLWRVRTPPATSGTGSAAAVTVVIPARDEEHNLPRLLESLEAQTEPPAEVVVVDDGSMDRTAAVARDAGVRVIEAGAPPAGWLGKPWACHQGVDAASGERLLFIDADTWLAPDGIARLVAAHDDLAPDGLLSVQPFHRVERAYEHLSAVCNVVSVLASGMAAPGTPRPSVAFGPCLLVRADALSAAGGFRAVRGEIVEDAALASAFRRVGRPVRCLGGGSTVSFRMYPEGVGSLVDGWTKNLSGGAARVAPLALLGAVLWVTAGLSVTVDAVTEPTGAVLVAWVAVAAQLWWALRRLGSFHWLTAVLFPIPLLAFVALFFRSLVLRLTHRPVSWRGRRIATRA